MCHLVVMRVADGRQTVIQILGPTKFLLRATMIQSAELILAELQAINPECV
jgi:hypothetical protein